MAKFLSPGQILYIEGGYRLGWGIQSEGIRIEGEWRDVARWHPWEEPKGEPPVRTVQVIRVSGPGGSTEWEIVDAGSILSMDLSFLAELAMVAAVLPTERVIIEGNFIALYFRRELNPREAFYLAGGLEEAIKPYELKPNPNPLVAIPDPLDWVVLWLA